MGEQLSSRLKTTQEVTEDFLSGMLGEGEKDISDIVEDRRRQRARGKIEFAMRADKFSDKCDK